MPRYHGFDYLRVAAILAVIYIHGCDTNPDARRWMKWLGFAVPCFFMMSAFLAQRSQLQNKLPYGQFIQHKFIRLAPAFFAWSGLYVLVRLLKSFATGTEMASGILGIVFWGDASYQLYFVPFLFYNFLAWGGVMIFSRRHTPATIAILTLSIPLFIGLEHSVESMLPNDRWFIAKNLVWFPIGMLFALVVTWWDGLGPRLFWPSVLALAAMVMANVVNVYALSISVMALAISIDRRPPEWIKTLSIYSLGVYLTHVLFIEVFQFFAPRIDLDPSSFAVTLGITIGAAVLSYATCIALGHTRSTRWSVT